VLITKGEYLKKINIKKTGKRKILSKKKEAIKIWCKKSVIFKF
jgi:ribosomal protein S19